MKHEGEHHKPLSFLYISVFFGCFVFKDRIDILLLRSLSVPRGSGVTSEVHSSIVFLSVVE